MSQLPMGLTIPPSFRCFSGTVTLFRFIQAPPPGSVIGTLTTMQGQQIPLVATQGGGALAEVEGRPATTVCGPIVTAGGQQAVDVRIINPGAPSPTSPLPPVNVNVNLNQLLTLLMLLVLQGGIHLGQAGLTSLQNLVNQLAAQGVDVNSLVARLGSQPSQHG